MPFTLAFDVYGTLIDTHGVVAQLQALIGDRAQGFSSRWREKQLEYAFRRGLMQNYASFAVCTSQALDYTCHEQGVALSAEQKQQLLQIYKTLPAFDDVKQSLNELQAMGCRLFAFSNGTAEAVDQLLQNAGIRQFFIDIISVDELKSFKPNPAVYSHFLRQSDAKASSAWLISSNPFDVIGSISAGMRSAWVQRSSNAQFDPWGIDPTLKVSSLSQLPQQLAEQTD
ncbi:haloacid dehalogenase type II [Motiliproteus coralliicola]|uniref:(S)-2-haloacid dehalogenase n=1 Tax=Motiliproteus coralliicola TaxID=2283196 RepID=A0A369WDR4_9GAMM|nr:haloacid dehalogenase type II [Motiliproteus coralliicola]RDE18834.1 haloacid dehalogenase type II [Motiliproteus coralliicola]